jgi:ABC-type bacteriocin/lantibiotic exporter with double-glycine peptidase domain
MVLAYYGKLYTEQELAFALQTVPLLGTLPENVAPALEEWGYHVRWFENGTIEQLTKLLAQRTPVIIYVRAADLPDGGNGLHALVLAGIDQRAVVLLDPTRKKDLRLAIKTFTQIWAKFGNQAIVIW